LGVVGGLGPLASAEFVKTLYEVHRFSREQDALRCVLLSDPRVPDRTEAILSGNEAEVGEWLVDALERLREFGAQRFVIACVTMHHFLDHLPAHLRARVVSLVDLTVDQLAASGGRWLMLSTLGTRSAGVFQRHPRWREVEAHVVWLRDEDQARLHEVIYRMKQHGDAGEVRALCEQWLGADGYRADGFIAGCTELHLLTRHLYREAPERPLRSIDPLFLVAQRAPALLAVTRGAMSLKDVTSHASPSMGGGAHEGSVMGADAGTAGPVAPSSLSPGAGPRVEAAG
ncbi:aspartate/glutamate racemase family protein, partial [Corallococcus terminator]